MEIGRKVFYLLSNGQPVLTINPFTIEYGGYVPPTKEHDFETYDALKGLLPDAVGVLEIPFGQDDDLFAKYPFRVDPATQEILWDTSVDLSTASLDLIKTAKIAQLNDFCNREIMSGFQSDALGEPHAYPSDTEAQMNFNIQMTRLLADSSLTSVSFKTLDRGYLSHNREQFTAVFNAGVTHGEGLVMKYNQLKAQVEAATTVDEVNAIQW